MTTPTPESTPEPDEHGVVHIDTAAASETSESADAAASELDDDSPADMRVVRKLRHEAATQRLRAKEAEAKVAEFEGAITRLADLERREVERIAAQDLIDGSDVWSAQPDLAAYYDDEFKQLVPDKVREATAALIAQKPHLAKDTTPQAPPTQQPLEGLRGGASPSLKKPEVSWASALRRSL